MTDHLPVSRVRACHDFPVPSGRRRILTQERFWGIEGTFEYVECPHCSSWVIAEEPSDEVLATHYAGYYPPEERALRLKQPINVVEYIRAAQTLSRIRRLGGSVEGIRVLDVGAGCGGFLAALGESTRANLKGCDQNPASVELARSLFDLNLDLGAFDELSYAPSSFSLITLWHCFEHVRQPAETLNQLRRLLDEQGLLVMEVPTTGFWARIFRGRWLFLQAPTHLNIFSPKGLVDLVERNGFLVECVERPWSPSEWAGSVLFSLGLKGFMPRVFFGPIRTADRLWRLLFWLLIPIDILMTGLSSMFGGSGLLRIYARPKSDTTTGTAR